MKIFVGISGASGAIYAGSLLRALDGLGHDYTACFSDHAVEVLASEAGEGDPARERVLERFAGEWGIAQLAQRTISPDEMGSAFASGSHLAQAAVICPCSMSTLACVAGGITMNLIHRVADVMLKESRPLVLVPRETPLGETHLANMLRVKRAGAILVPAMPAFYHRPRRIEDLADFITGKVLDVLGVEHDLFARWQGAR